MCDLAQNSTRLFVADAQRGAAWCANGAGVLPPATLQDNACSVHDQGSCIAAVNPASIACHTAGSWAGDRARLTALRCTPAVQTHLFGLRYVSCQQAPAVILQAARCPVGIVLVACGANRTSRCRASPCAVRSHHDQRDPRPRRRCQRSRRHQRFSLYTLCQGHHRQRADVLAQVVRKTRNLSREF
jgi:hypothetical protein